MKLKKTIALFSIKSAMMLSACLLAGDANSQLYGEYGYNFSGYSLCSGNTGVIYPSEPGLVLAGNAVAVGQANQFTIVRTDQGGQMTTSPWVFANEYAINYDPFGCGSISTAATECYGVSVIETNAPLPVSMNIRYIATGAFNGGVFYAELSPTGAVLNNWFCALPGAASQVVGKPVICESTINPGEYYITGFQGGQLYVFKYVAGAATPAVSQFYNSGYCVPKAIRMSPYGGNDITIIGETSTTGTQLDAFFLQLDNNTLSPTTYNVYDVAARNDGFTSIDIANSFTPNGPGFVVGGYCDGISASSSWFIKLDPIGNLNGFSNVIQCSSDPQTSAVVGIVERLNTSFQYEYYGAPYSGSNLLVVKLDDTGMPPSTSEFNYPIGGNAYAIGLSDINTPGPDEGLQIYATDRFGIGTFFSAQSCFSGNSGCSSVSSINNLVNVVPSINFPGLGISSSMSGCYNNGIDFKVFPMNVTVQGCGSSPYVGAAAAGGNNFRPAAVTGMAQLSAENTGMQVYPSPATNKIQVTFKAGVGDNVKIELFDYLGRLVTSLPVSVTEKTQTTDINLNSLNIESGIYVISAKINGNTTTQKIIYNKE